VQLVYGAFGCHKGQKARAPVTCMLRVCTYSCAVIDCGISLFNSTQSNVEWKKVSIDSAFKQLGEHDIVEFVATLDVALKASKCNSIIGALSVTKGRQCLVAPTKIEGWSKMTATMTGRGFVAV